MLECVGEAGKAHGTAQGGRDTMGNLRAQAGVAWDGQCDPAAGLMFLAGQGDSPDDRAEP